jgi:hypothetical protein
VKDDAKSKSSSTNDEAAADVAAAGDPGVSTEAWSPPDPIAPLEPQPFGVHEPLPEPATSSPLDEEEPEGPIPPAPLWTMKDRRHVQWSEIVGLAPKRIRMAFGSGNAAVYVIEDGHHHVMVGRQAGTVADGCDYVLVGRAPLSVYEELEKGRIQSLTAFNEADQITLCGVDIDERDKASDIFAVEFYGAVSAVPEQYLPGHPPVEFATPLPISDP